jgi:small subunit ribosomal protein S3Ae
MVRKIAQDVISATAAELSLGDFVKEMLDGRLGQKILKAAKPIYPIRKIEMNKSEVRTAPTITLDDLEPAAPVEGEAPPPGDEGASAEAPAPERAEEEGEAEAVEVAKAE